MPLAKCGESGAKPWTTGSRSRPQVFYELVESFRRMASESAVLWWKQGKILLRIHDEEVYRLKYDSWAAFAREELSLSEHYARSLMRIAREFTEERAVRLGVTRCVTILKAEESARPALEAEALAEGTTNAALRARVIKMNERRETYTPSTPGKQRRPHAMPRAELQRFLRVELAPGEVARLKELAGDRRAEHLAADVLRAYLADRRSAPGSGGLAQVPATVAAKKKAC